MPEKQEPNIREYNFAVGGNIQRHIPGIPGFWPFGSRVQVNEDTNQVVSVWPEDAKPMVPTPVEQEKPFSGTITVEGWDDKAGGIIPTNITVEPETPPALQSEQPVQQGG